MSARLILALILLGVGCVMTIRRPFYGVLLNIILFHVNPVVFGAGLEDVRFQFYATIVLVASYLIHYQEIEKPPEMGRNKMQVHLMWTYSLILFMVSLWAPGSQDEAFWGAYDFAKVILFAWLITRIVHTEKEVRILVWVILLSCGYVGAMANWGVKLDLIDDTEVGIATGGAGTHLMLFFPLLLIATTNGNRWEALMGLVILVFVMDFLPSTDDGKRATFLNLVCASAGLVLLTRGRIRLRALGALLVGLLALTQLTPPGYWEEIKTILNPHEESSANSRFAINQASIQMVRDYPLGVGLGNYVIMSQDYIPDEYLSETGRRGAHNSYVAVATEAGLLGLIVWFLLFGYTIRTLTLTKRMNLEKMELWRLQSYAVALRIGLFGISLGIATHNRNDLDSLYWVAALSYVIMRVIGTQAAKSREEESSLADAGAKSTLAST